MRWCIAALLVAAPLAAGADSRHLHATFYPAGASQPQGTVEVALEPPVPPLTAARLMEDGHEGNPPLSQKQFKATSYGVTAILAIDTSGSVQGAPLDAVKNALKDYVSSSRAQDRIAVMSFADTITVRQAFTADKAQLTRAIDALHVEGKQTLLNAAMAKGLALLAAETSNPRRHLLVITDGKNEGAGPTGAELADTAQKADIPVDCIGVTRLAVKYLAPMQALAAASGGVYLRAKGYEQLKEAMRQGIDGLLGSPVVTFKLAKIGADGQKHSLQVRLPGMPSDAVSVLFPAAPKSDTVLYVSITAAVVLFGLGLMLIYRSRKSVPVSATSVPVTHTSAPHVTPAHPAHTDQPRPPRVATVYESRDLIHPGAGHSGGSAAPARAPDAPARAGGGATEFRQVFNPPAVGRPVAWFRLVSQPGTTTPVPTPKFPIDDTEIWIGSSETNQICVAHDTAVSRTHACIQWVNGDLYLMDNRSTNGTVVNAQAMQSGTRVRLRIGDQVKVGQSVFAIDPPE